MVNVKDAETTGVIKGVFLTVFIIGLVAVLALITFAAYDQYLEEQEQNKCLSVKAARFCASHQMVLVDSKDKVGNDLAYICVDAMNSKRTILYTEREIETCER